MMCYTLCKPTERGNISMKKIRRAVAMLIASAMLLGFAGCQKEVTAENLTENVNAENASEVDLDDDFCKKYSTFAFKLLQNMYESDEKNVVISPLSVSYNLGLLYNGANGDTTDQLRGILGTSLNVNEMNVYMHSYNERLTDSDLTTLYFNNAMWVNADKSVTPSQAFLQANATYYGNAIYKESFNADAVTNISNWISNETNQNVEYIVDSLPADAPIYMLSSLMFDATWSKQYSYQNIQKSAFTTASGQEQEAQMMSAFEYSYIHDELAKGFIKEYSGGNYAFIALLPEENIKMKDYIGRLAVGDKYAPLLKSKRPDVIDVTMPKFTCEYRGGMSDILTKMKLGRAFDSNSGDLSMLGTSDGRLYAGDLFVRNSFSVTEKGTSKGTAASVADDNNAATNTHVISLTRPFMFMVVDTNYNLPVLLGVVNSME